MANPHYDIELQLILAHTTKTLLIVVVVTSRYFFNAATPDVRPATSICIWKRQEIVYHGNGRMKK